MFRLLIKKGSTVCGYSWVKTKVRGGRGDECEWHPTDVAREKGRNGGGAKNCRIAPRKCGQISVNVGKIGGRRVDRRPKYFRHGFSFFEAF